MRHDPKNNEQPDLNEKQPQDTKKDIRRSALNSLARRDHSQREIKQKLQSKGYSPEDIDAVIADLVQEKLINDHHFAENYVYWRGKKGYGPQRILRELEVRGIASDVIAEHLKITDNAWFAEARNVWQKRFKGRTPDDFNERAKQMRFLQQRGFTREQIESVFSGISKEID